MWIEALLDPEPIERGTTKEHQISSPPRYELPMSKMSSRSRSLRSASPTKPSATPARKIASPRKRASKKDRDNANATSGTGTMAASSTLNRIVNGVDASPNEAGSGNNNNIKGNITGESDYAMQSDRQVRQELTAVKVERSSSGRHQQQHNSEPQVIQSTEAMVAKARKMVDEANKFTQKQASSTARAIKRKASEFEDDPDYNDLEGEGAGAGGAGRDARDAPPAAKKARVLEEQLKKEKVKARALIGITATIAIG